MWLGLFGGIDLVLVLVMVVDVLGVVNVIVVWLLLCYIVDMFNDLVVE